MTDTVAVAIIGSTGLVLVAVITVVGNKLAAGQAKIGSRMDGRMDELLELTRKSSRAEGVKAELDRDK